MSVCFVVTIDQHPLGAFSSCEGLGCEVVVEQREEGGNNGFVWQLPTRLKFSNIKLSRPVTADTSKVIEWFASMTSGVVPTNASIEAKTADGRTVAEWALRDVIPVRWTGPQLNLDSPKVAMETIEIAHHGFTPKNGGGA